MQHMSPWMWPARSRQSWTTEERAAAAAAYEKAAETGKVLEEALAALEAIKAAAPGVWRSPSLARCLPALSLLQPPLPAPPLTSSLLLTHAGPTLGTFTLEEVPGDW